MAPTLKNTADSLMLMFVLQLEPGQATTSTTAQVFQVKRPCDDRLDHVRPIDHVKAMAFPGVATTPSWTVGESVSTSAATTKAANAPAKSEPVA